MTKPSSQDSRPTAASYARTGTADETALDAQHARNEENAQRDGFEIPDDAEFRYEDLAASGLGDRDGFSEMIDLIQSGTAPFDRVYMPDPSRLGRFSDPREHFALEARFARHGVRICYAPEA